VLSAPEYDVVGIAAKALGTRFGTEFGRAAFPCLEHEVEWVKTALPGRKPVVVPPRLLKILRRGGYFDTQRVSDEMWFLSSRPPNDGEEKKLVMAAIELLVRADCHTVHLDQIVFVASPEVNEDAIAQKAVCKYSRLKEQYCVQEKFMGSKIDELASCAAGEADTAKARAYLLGMYLAMEHPDGNVLAGYLLRNKV
jgi:hypothetical protein